MNIRDFKCRYLLSATFLFLMASCSVDNAYDLSKDVDMTVAVGDGLSIPLGSTGRIMLTEMIDPEDSDVLDVTQSGYYSILKSGEIDPTTIEVDEVEIEIAPVSQKELYDFSIVGIDPKDEEALNRLPEEVKNNILSKMEYSYVVNEVVDHSKVSYTIDQNVPEEMVLLRRMEFRQPVKLTMDIEIYSEDYNADFDALERLHLHTDGNENNDHFYMTMPSYLVFKEGTPMGSGNRLWLDYVAEHKDYLGHKHFQESFEVVALDFSAFEGGGVPVENGRILVVEDDLEINGTIVSEPITFTGGELLEKISDIYIEPTLSFEKFVIESVVGRFDPQIDVVEESIDIDLGDDMDFIYDAALDFSNPQIFVTINSDGVTLPVLADITLKGQDKFGYNLSNVDMSMNVAPNCENKYYITPSGASLADYSSVVADLNALLRPIPHEVLLELNASIDNTGFNTVYLGRQMEVSGSYDLNIPLDFSRLDLTYTETVEDVLGEDSEDVTDYVENIESVTIKADVLNTVPAKFDIEVIAKDSWGNRLYGITAEIEGNIAMGNGMDNNDEVTEPVESSIEIKLGAMNGELEELCDLDILLHGTGSGAFNNREYLQIKNMSVTIDKPLVVDMN